MADIRVTIQLQDTVEDVVNSVKSSSDVNNVSIQKTQDVFNKMSSKSDGANLKSWATGFLSLADGYVGGANTQLVEQYGYNGYVFGVVPESKQLSVTIEVVGENIDSIIVYGDKKANQFATKAYLDGDTTNIIYSNDAIWAIRFSQAKSSHTITFLEWNRANYNACISSVQKLSNILELDKSVIKSIEQTEQATDEPSELRYSALASVGSINIVDKSQELSDFVSDGVIDFSRSDVSSFFNSKKINSYIVDSNSVKAGDYSIELNTSDNISNISRYVVENAVLYGWDAIEMSSSTIGEYLCNPKIGTLKEKSLYEILYHSLFYYLFKKKREELSIDNLRNFHLLGFGGMISDLVGTKKSFSSGNSRIYIYSDNTSSAILNNKHFVALKAKGSGSFTFGVKSGNDSTFSLSENEKTYSFFYTPTSNVENSDTFELSLASNSNIEIECCVIVDLTALSLQDKSLDWCYENFVLFDKVEEILNKEILGLGISVKDYLSSFYVGFANIDNLSLNEILNKICEVSQLQIIQKDKEFVFINGRPTKTSEQKIINIPLNSQFSGIEYNMFLSNKYDSVKINEQNFRQISKRVPSNLSLFKEASILRFSTRIEGLYYADGWKTHNTYPNFVFKKFSAIDGSNYSYIQSSGDQTYVIYQNGEMLSNGQVSVYSNFSEALEYVHSKNEIFVVGREDFYNHECIYFIYNPDRDLEIYIGGDVVIFEKIDAEEKVFAPQEISAQKSAEIPTNDFFQTMSLVGDVSFSQNIANNIYNDYKKGIRSCKLSVGCLDFYDTEGNLIKDSTKGDLIELGDCIKIDKDNLGNSKFTDSSGVDVIWKVVGRVFRYNGCPFLDLTLQEIKQ